MEACENYQKQSYRNRCLFCAENGVQALSFPIRHREGSISIPIKEVEVDYSVPWVQKTERCLDTAYRSSAFFDYYRNPLFAILDSRPDTLWELDMRIIEFFIEKFGLCTELVETVSYHGPDIDIHPKRTNTILSDFGLGKPYYQVFREKLGFVSGLSAMDLLFNEGPLAIEFIR